MPSVKSNAANPERRGSLVGSEPCKSAGHHQVNHDVQAVGKVKHDPFPQASNTVNTYGGDGVNRGVVCLEHRETLDSHPLKLRPDHSRPQRVQIRLDLRELRHGETRDERLET